MGSTVGCKNLLVCAYFWEKNAPDRMYFTQPMGGGTISPTLHYPRTHYSTIPLFHHSNCERSELTCNEITLSGRSIENCGNRFLLAEGRLSTSIEEEDTVTNPLIMSSSTATYVVPMWCRN